MRARFLWVLYPRLMLGLAILMSVLGVTRLAGADPRDTPPPRLAHAGREPILPLERARDVQIAVALAHLPGVSQVPSAATGQAVINVRTSRVTVSVQHLPLLPPGVVYRVLLVENTPGPGHSVALDWGTHGDAILDLGVLALDGTEARLDTRVEPAWLRQRIADLVVVTRETPGTPAVVVLAGFTSLAHKLERQPHRIAARPRVTAHDAPRGWFQRLWRRLIEPAPVAAGTAATAADPQEALLAQGWQLFMAETFAGNGRTCATCHRPERHCSIDPAFIETLPATDPCSWRNSTRRWQASKIRRCCGSGA